MMRRFKQMSLGLFLLMASASSLNLAFSTPSYAADPPCKDGTARLLTFPAWYNGIVDDQCNIEPLSNSDDSLRLTAFFIGLNIVEIAIQLVAYATIIFLIKGGFDYVTSVGNQTKMTAAKNTLQNALIGLVIALSAVAIVNTIARVI